MHAPSRYFFWRPAEHTRRIKKRVSFGRKNANVPSSCSFCQVTIKFLEHIRAGGGGGNKVLAAAQHIVKSLATSKNAIADMIRILSGFDNRLSSITNDHLFPSPDPSSSSGSTSASGSSASEISTAAAFDAADQLIQLWDATPEALVFEAPEDDVVQYLAAVNVAVEHFSRGGPDGARAGVAVQLAMARLEEELRHLMPGRDPRQVGGQVFDPMRPEAVDEQRAIADRMALAGYSRELADAYCDVRRDLLDEYLSVLGVERLSIDEVQRIEWKLLNDKMKKWVHGVKTVVRVLLDGERRLCDQSRAVDVLLGLPDLEQGGGSGLRQRPEQGGGGAGQRRHGFHGGGGRSIDGGDGEGAA
ncbi:hypothetical protein C2845_PM01G04410 [Panicum miliaceum]|uniref:Exocyst subunit Exo70 family protein n=1 Tax=Panicum miliaceum TaxID=4540 RepID=A0A3L6TP49_PANMI|nr:hypothetical protein C2845_PM01G04410 [Panicum miliaceum]